MTEIGAMAVGCVSLVFGVLAGVVGTVWFELVDGDEDLATWLIVGSLLLVFGALKLQGV